MAEYQGHRSWNAWNVALYINNEYHLYDMVHGFYHEARTRFGKNHAGAIRMTTNAFMRRLGGERTPDGAIYNHLCVKLAITDLCEEWEND